MESLVDAMHERGLCISYYRLRTLSTDIANSIIRSMRRVALSFLCKPFEGSSPQMHLTISTIIQKQ